MTRSGQRSRSRPKAKIIEPITKSEPIPIPRSKSMQNLAISFPIINVSEIQTQLESGQQECMLCHEEFNNYEYIYIVNDCGHTFHIKCLKSYIPTSTTPQLNEYKACPQCVLETYPDMFRFSSNFFKIKKKTKKIRTRTRTRSRTK